MSTTSQLDPDYTDGKNYLHELPVELKCEVISYLSQLDKKTLALVNIEWKDIVLPILWNTFVTDFVPTDKRRLIELTRPDSHILKYIQNLRYDPNSDLRLWDLANEQLPTLICAIPKNQLLSFECYDVFLSKLAFRILLQQQQNMHKLCVAGEPGANLFLDILRSPWGPTSFSQLSEIKVHPDTENAEGIRMLLDQTPCLKTLTFKALKYGMYAFPRMAEDSFTTDPEESDVTRMRKLLSRAAHDSKKAMELQNLTVRDIRLPASLDSMLQRFDFCQIRALSLVGCCSASRLFRCLAATFKDKPTSLVKLHVSGVEKHESPTFSHDTSRFLTSFTGLDVLQIYCDKNTVIDVEAIAKHGSTLRVLTVCMGTATKKDQSCCYSAAELARLASSCPNLEVLCLNVFGLAKTNLKRDFAKHLPLPSELDLYKGDMRAALQAIASLERLGDLRLTRHPVYRYLDRHKYTYRKRLLESGIVRVYIQEEATKVFRVLDEFGSNVKVLRFAAGPSADERASELKVCPNYYYVRGKVSNSKGLNTVVATPYVE